MNENDGLGKALVATLQSDAATSIAKDVVEVAIDAALKEGLLKDVPVVSTLISLANLGFTVSDQILIRKLLKFISGLDEISPDERRLMVDKLEVDDAYGRRVGEHVIELLAGVDSHRKPYMVSRVFAAYVKGVIDARTLNRLNHAIDRVPIFVVDSLREIYATWAARDKDKNAPAPDAPEWVFHDLAAWSRRSPPLAGLRIRPTTWGRGFWSWSSIALAHRNGGRRRLTDTGSYRHGRGCAGRRPPAAPSLASGA